MADKMVYEYFDSIRDFVSAITTRKPRNSYYNNSHDPEQGKRGRGFFGTESFDAAMNLLKNGWEEPLDEIKKGVNANFKSNTVRNKNLPRTGIVGYAPCVPNAILGLPNSMISTERTPTKTKVITIVYAISVTADITAKQLRKAGVNVLNIINNLELAGYRVRLNVEFVSTMINGVLHTVRVNVKDWRQPLDLKKLAFPIANPSAFRRMGWRWLETSPQTVSCDYGSSNFKEDYENAVETYKRRNLLPQNEYLITSYLCFESNHDETKITETCGLSAIK